MSGPGTLQASLPEWIRQARKRIAPHVLLTPLTPAAWRDDFNLNLKCEHLQYTGSFKLRGALNRLLCLDAAERKQGVIAASTGNHGQGIALAARLTGIDAKVFVPRSASPVKLAAMRASGIEVEEVDGDGLAAELAARECAHREGRVFVSPYNDAQVIAGQGTIGEELAEQLPTLDAVFVSVGGGGLISGIAAALKAHNPDVRVIGCWPENAPALKRCLDAGEIFNVPEQPTISDGTAGGLEDNSITFDLCRSLIDDHVLVSETEIHAAMQRLAQEERWIVEGSAGVALAGCLQCAPELRGQKVAVVLCGRNIDYARFLEVAGS